MMVFRLPPDQVAKNWELIKFAAAKSEGVKEKDIPMYTLNLLHDLLNEKAQCFVRVNDKKEAIRLAITFLKSDKITGKKSLIISCLYAFKAEDTDKWAEDMDVLVEFAKKNDCSEIIGFSNNEKLFKLAESLNLKETYRHYVMEV